MTNPRASGWYWVWRQPKDIDRNISEAMYWSNGAGWHDDDVSSRVTEGPHTHEFAAWVGPLTSRVPPESREEVEAELAANMRVGTRATLRPPMTRERLDEIDAEAKCPLLEVGFLGESVPAQALMALAAAQRLVSKQGAVIVELTTAVRSLVAQCEGYADGYDLLNSELARLTGLAKPLPSGGTGPGIELENPEAFKVSRLEWLDEDKMPRYKCGRCGQFLGRVRVSSLPGGGGPFRYCPSCGSELGELPPELPEPIPPLPVGELGGVPTCGCGKVARETFRRVPTCGALPCRNRVETQTGGPPPDPPPRARPGVVHVTGCELGENWKDCPACVAAYNADRPGRTLPQPDPFADL